MATRDESVVKVLVDRFGATSAEQAGIQLADKPSPLYQLLVLSTLLSARISGDIAVAAAKELFRVSTRSTCSRSGRTRKRSSRAGRTRFFRSSADPALSG